MARRRLALGAVVALVLLVLGASAASGQTLYTTQGYLTPTYTRPYSAHYWNGALLNDSSGNALAFFVFAFRGTNQSQGPIGITLNWGPNVPGGSTNVPVYIDSLQVTFSPDSPGDWPDVGVRASSTSGGLSPTGIFRGSDGQAVVAFDNLGFYGTGTETVDLWFQLLGVGPSSSANHTVTLTADLAAHSPHPFLIGSSYAAEATFHLVVEPSGLVVLSEG